MPSCPNHGMTAGHGGFARGRGRIPAARTDRQGMPAKLPANPLFLTEMDSLKR